jgi:hypothetical protein
MMFALYQPITNPSPGLPASLAKDLTWYLFKPNQGNNKDSSQNSQTPWRLLSAFWQNSKQLF